MNERERKIIFLTPLADKNVS